MSFELLPSALLIARGGQGIGSLGCFVFILLFGLVLYFVLRGRRDRPEQLGAAKRAMGSGPLPEHTFACPYAKCPSCAAAGDKMKSQWDGLRKVTWTCGYCGTVAGVQELKDEELPPSARQRLGLDAPRQEFQQGMPYQGSGGDLLTGVMIGTMLGSSHRNEPWIGGSEAPRNEVDAGGWNDAGSGPDAGGDWNDAGSGSDAGSDWSDAGSGGDWGGGGDSGGSDW